MQLAMINDKIIPIDALDSAHLDRGFYFGDGVYDVLRSYNGKLFALEEHLARFSDSLKAVGIKFDIAIIRQRIEQTFDQAKMSDAKIYFHVTRGSCRRGHTWPIDLEPNFFLTIDPAPDSAPVKAVGYRVCTCPDYRWKLCHIKSLNLLPNVMAHQYAFEKGCDEAILVNEQGLITEGSASTFYAIKDNQLYTSPLGSNILPSVTRVYTLKAAKELDIQIIEKSITPSEAISCDELFTAATTKDIVGVISFDDHIISGGRPGAITRRLSDKFATYIV